jgi:KUP system potassium uptake protein
MFAVVLFIIMVTWRAGIDAVRAALPQSPDKAEQFLADLKLGVIPRVSGTTIFLTRSAQKVSRLITDHAHFVGVLPQHAIALSIVFESTPRIEGPNCSVVEHVGEGVWHVVARFGFFEIPDLYRALEQAQGLDEGIELDKAMFVGSRDLVVCKTEGPSLSGWRLSLFAFLYRNSVKLVDRFNLPPANVVEIARQIEI